MSPRRRRPLLTPTQLIVISFLVVTVAGGFFLSLPLAARRAPLGPIDGLFQATTAVCVTGLVTVDPGQDLSRTGQVAMLLLIQVGGLGYMVLSTAFMMLLGQRVRLRDKVVLSQALGESRLGQVTGLLTTAIGFTALCEGLGAVLLMFCFRRYGTPWGVSLELGIFHSISAFCNAGIDILRDPAWVDWFPTGSGNLTPFVRDPWLSGVISALIVAGGIGFVVALDLRHLVTAPRHHRRLSLHTKIVLLATAVLLAGGMAVFLLLEWNNPDTLGPLGLTAKLSNALFQSVTTRTAGFVMVPQGNLYPASQLFSIFLMFIGASPGGTGGGIKTTTFVVIVLAALASVRGDDEVQCFKRRIGTDEVFRALAVVFFMALALGGGTFLLGVFEHHALATSAAPGLQVEHQFLEFGFEVSSALATVGLSTGITPALSPASKLLLIAGMLCGRIGPVTLATALAARKRRYVLRYPRESVVIG